MTNTNSFEPKQITKRYNHTNTYNSLLCRVCKPNNTMEQTPCKRGTNTAPQSRTTSMVVAPHMTYARKECRSSPEAKCLRKEKRGGFGGRLGSIQCTITIANLYNTRKGVGHSNLARGSLQ